MAESLREQDVATFVINAVKKEETDDYSVTLNVDIPCLVYHDFFKFQLAAKGIKNLLALDLPDLKVLFIGRVLSKRYVESLLISSSQGEDHDYILFDESSFLLTIHELGKRISRFVEDNLVSDFISSIVLEFKTDVQKDHPVLQKYDLLTKPDSIANKRIQLFCCERGTKCVQCMRYFYYI